jgi:cell wall-associated NlpC family hydrolase
MADSQIYQKETYIITNEMWQKIKEYIGKPYKFNCFDETGFDCYTLIYFLYKLIDIDLPKENIALYNLRVHQKLIDTHRMLFKEVKYIERQPFDILLFANSDKIAAHLGMVLTRDKFIHANEDHSVRIEYFLGNIESINIRKVYRWNSLK